MGSFAPNAVDGQPRVGMTGDIVDLSQTAAALLAGGAGTQETPLGAAIWTLLGSITARDQDISLQ